MARNRRSQSAAVRFGPVLKVLLLCLFVGGAGVGYIWQKTQINALAAQKKAKENSLDKLRSQNRVNRDRLETLRLPWALEARVKELKLGLGPPQPEQILRLTESYAGTPRSLANRQYADQGLRKDVVR